MGDLVRTKQLNGRDAGGSCGFVAKGQREDEILEVALDHICPIYEICEVISSESENRWRSLMKNGWAGGYI